MKSIKNKTDFSVVEELLTFLKKEGEEPNIVVQNYGIFDNKRDKVYFDLNRNLIIVTNKLPISGHFYNIPNRYFFQSVSSLLIGRTNLNNKESKERFITHFYQGINDLVMSIQKSLLTEDKIENLFHSYFLINYRTEGLSYNNYLPDKIIDFYKKYQ